MNVTLQLNGYAGAPTAKLPPNIKSKSQVAGQDFESMLLTDLFGKLRQSFALDGDDTDAAGGTLSGIADQALAEAVAARGGLGLGRLLSRTLDTKNP